MTNDHLESPDPTHSEPRLERWLLVTLVALVPLLAAFVVERDLRTPFYIAGGAIAAAGLAMLAFRRGAP